MTPLYVLCYIIYHTISSAIFSLFLAFRHLLRRVSDINCGSKEGNVVALYEGTVCHVRRQPVHNSFKFPARFALINLDRPPFSPPNFLSADDARRAAKTNGPVFLLRIPPSVGYETSPVNFYYCYDIEGSERTLKKCMVKVTNTPWGESATFVFNPSSDLVPKAEYISPYMDMDSNWSIKVNDPGENLYAFVTVQHPKFGNYFTASLTAKRVMITSFMPEDYEAFFWLMPHKVSITTYWNALKLWWKNVPFYEHPRKRNAAYREEIMARDEKIQCCRAFRGNEANKQLAEGTNMIDRSFIWKDSKWPWSWC